MNELEKKTKTTKQWKVGITEKGWQELNQFLDRANKASKRKIKSPEVLELAVQKLSESDIPKIQERTYTAMDKLENLMEQINVDRPTEKRLTKDELLVDLIKCYKHKPSGSSLKKDSP